MARRGRESGGGNWDEALQRLEDFLLAYPMDRALPDLPSIAQRASLPAEFLREDERAHKVIHEALVGRPLTSIDAVVAVRTEVELLTLEVEVLADRLRAAADEDDIAAVVERIDAVRARLDEVRRLI